jgi:hypothetical protein
MGRRRYGIVLTPPSPQAAFTTARSGGRMLDTVESGVVRQLDGTTRAPVAWDHLIGVSTSAAG